MSSGKRKRSDGYSKSNKKCGAQQNFILKEKFTDISKAYDYLRSIFATEVFNNRIPIIVWRHQLYALFDNRTQIDRQLNNWSETGYIRLFRLGSTVNNNDVVVVLMEDFQQFVNKCREKTIITERFLKKVVYEKPSTQISGDELKNQYHFNDNNISELIRCGLLARHRTVGIFLFSVPNAGEFIKCLDFGKKVLISIINKTKYKEISKSDLMIRRFPNDMKFSIEYHIYDLIGSDRINCVKTATDTLFRLS